MKIKTIIAACAVLATALGALATAAEAQPMMHGHHRAMHHRSYHHGYRHHGYRHHRHGSVAGSIARGVARHM